MTSLMKMFVGCHIQGYLGPTIASLKHHWVMESPQITKALNKDMNNFQKSFYLSQKHEQQLKEQRESVLVTPLLCSCWVSEAMGPSEVQKQQNIARNFFASKFVLIILRCSKACQKMHLATWRTAAGQVQRVSEKVLLDWSVQCRCVCVCTLCTKDYLALPAWGWDKC